MHALNEKESTIKCTLYSPQDLFYSQFMQVDHRQVPRGFLLGNVKHAIEKEAY